MYSFDAIPDPLILLIFNSIYDIKTLLRLRAVSKRFSSLVPQTHSLLLKVDRVVSSDSDHSDSSLLTFIASSFKFVRHFLSSHLLPSPPGSNINSPAKFLRGFERVRDLEVELPGGELWLEKGTVVKWKARFGRTLESCVILMIGFGTIGDSRVTTGGFFGCGSWLKTRVLLTINALLAASARHYMLKELVMEHREVERLTVKDKEGEGIVVMDREGIEDYLGEPEVEGAKHDRGRWERESGSGRRRTRVPSVKMKMMYEPMIKLKSGLCVEGATLVLVRSNTADTPLGTFTPVNKWANMEKNDAELARELGDFGEVYGEAVQKLLKARSYLLQMNSF